MSGQRRSKALRQINMVFTTWPVMCGNGAATGTMQITIKALRQELPTVLKALLAATIPLSHILRKESCGAEVFYATTVIAADTGLPEE